MELIVIIALVIFLFGLAVAFWIGIRFGNKARDAYWEKEIPAIREDAILRSRAVLGGQFSEQLAPYLPDFPYSPMECRFMGKPIDFIVFKGADDKKIEEVVFVEVKSGKSKINSHERKLKETIESGRVRWEEYHIPDDITK